MTITYGFYNSQNGDRVYSADEFSSLFDGILADGIFQSIGNAFAVSQDTGSNMDVIVKSGRAWFNRTWTFNDNPISVTVPNADPVYDRIDTLALEVNATTRVNSIKIVTGTAAATPVAPTLTDSGSVHQHRLADIYVTTSVTAITNTDITNFIGTTETPFVTGILETIDMDWLFANWEQQFDTWFDNLVDQLTGTQVTNLQAQIDLLALGWVGFSTTLTYVDANTMSITAGAQSFFQFGDKIRLKQGGSFKYFYVYDVPSDTQIKITAGADYSLANATITDVAYSRAVRPFGFPAKFSWNPTYTGFSTDPTGSSCEFTIQGGSIQVYLKIAPGTSNSTSFQISTPFTYNSSMVTGSVGLLMYVTDNAALVTTSPGRIATIDQNTYRLDKDYSAINGWTASNTKSAITSFVHNYV